jgi:hypothetical protein
MFVDFYLKMGRKIRPETPYPGPPRDEIFCIKDSDFYHEEFLSDEDDGLSADLVLIRMLIRVYEEKNLNVAANIYLAMRHNFLTFGWPINPQIQFFEKKLKDFSKYKNDIQKYILIGE